MNMMKLLVGGSLVVVGLLAAVGGTSSIFTAKLPVVGVSFLQVGGALVTLLGVSVLVGFDPLGLKKDVSGASVL
jgi:hypothetical protein